MSTRHELIISNETYLVPDADVPRVEREILDAVHTGGAFIGLRTGLMRSVRVLVTPATPVSIEHTDLVFIEAEWPDAVELPRWED